ncbi:MAG TPA: chorismate lyase [Cellvibrio sp.]|nr:chorismate lyase [Cellvibrio sp.]
MLKAANTPSPALSWRPLRAIVRPQRPHPQLQDWLLDSGSLTARLIAKSDGQFRVRVLRQFIGVPRLDERQILGMQRSTLALVREVILYGEDQPWVFARSLLPLASLTGSLRHLRKQNNRPLGAFLFSQPQLTRSPIALARISRDHTYVPGELMGAEPLWGRRSVFYLEQKPLLVSEVFLPAFVARLDA